MLLSIFRVLWSQYQAIGREFLNNNSIKEKCINIEFWSFKYDSQVLLEKKELPNEQILNTPFIIIHSYSFKSEIARDSSIGWSHGSPMRFGLSLGINIRMVLLDGMGTHYTQWPRLEEVPHNFIIIILLKGFRNDI